jgi:hypothetical protein
MPDVMYDTVASPPLFVLSQVYVSGFYYHHVCIMRNLFCRGNACNCFVFFRITSHQPARFLLAATATAESNHKRPLEPADPAMTGNHVPQWGSLVT